MKKMKHKLVMTVYEDGSIEYVFEGYENWAAGKMQGHIQRAVRELKRQQSLAMHQRKLKEHEATRKAEAEEQARKEKFEAELKEAKERVNYLNLKYDNGELTPEDANEMKGIAKSFPTLNIKEEVLNYEHDSKDRPEPGRQSENDSGNGSPDKAAAGYDETVPDGHAEKSSGVSKSNAGSNDTIAVRNSGNPKVGTAAQG